MGTTSFSQPRSVRLFRSAAIPAARLIFRLGCRVIVKGMENVPLLGPYIVAMNHLAVYDPPLLITFWPHPPEALGAADMLEKFFVGHLMRAYGTIPVHRGEFDRLLIDKALAVLRSNRPVLIAPEGGRTRKPGMRQAKPGVAYLALKAEAPIVPAAVTGTELLMPSWQSLRRPRLTLTVGRPFRLPADPIDRAERHERLAELTALIMRRIAEMLPPEYRGRYA